FRTMARLNSKMFDRLQQKWKVSGWQLLLIILTFAIGGSLTGYVAKKIMNLIALHQDWLWAIIYILLVTIIWPVMVILISVPFGQFRFFRKYIKKIGVRMGIRKSEDRSQRSDVRRKTSEVRMAIFASGAGSNAQKIIDHFRN